MHGLCPIYTPSVPDRCIVCSWQAYQSIVDIVFLSPNWTMEPRRLSLLRPQYSVWLCTPDIRWAWYVVRTIPFLRRFRLHIHICCICKFSLKPCVDGVCLNFIGELLPPLVHKTAMHIDISVSGRWRNSTKKPLSYAQRFVSLIFQFEL